MHGLRQEALSPVIWPIVTRPRLRFLLATLLGVLPSFGQPAPAITWREADDPSLAPHLADAQSAIDILYSTLASSVAAAVAEGGPPRAVTVCQLSAQPLTRASLPPPPSRVTRLIRTSLRLRSPANAPDDADQAALRRVAALLAARQPPPPLLVQELSGTSRHPAEIRIYKPITVAAQCLTCHGDPATFSPDLQDILRERYPDDAATGYHLNDWRGLIRVSLKP